MLPRRFQSASLLISGASLLAALLAGCSGAANHRTSAHGNAPSLTDDAPNHGRAGTNPNAPFTLIDRTPQAATRLASTSPQDAAPCSGKDLALTEIAAENNGNDHVVKFAFVNQGSVACRIGGYPSIDLLDEDGKPVASVAVEQSSNQTLDGQTAPAAAARGDQAEAPQVVLDPHSEAYFSVGWTTGDDCPIVSRVVMTAPGTSQEFTVNRPLKLCSGKVHVTALRSTQNAS